MRHSFRIISSAKIVSWDEVDEKERRLTCCYEFHFTNLHQEQEEAQSRLVSGPERGLARSVRFKWPMGLGTGDFCRKSQAKGLVNTEMSLVERRWIIGAATWHACLSNPQFLASIFTHSTTVCKYGTFISYVPFPRIYSAQLLQLVRLSMNRRELAWFYVLLRLMVLNVGVAKAC